MAWMAWGRLLMTDDSPGMVVWVHGWFRPMIFGLEKGHGSLDTGHPRGSLANLATGLLQSNKPLRELGPHGLALWHAGPPACVTVNTPPEPLGVRSWVLHHTQSKPPTLSLPEPPAVRSDGVHPSLPGRRDFHDMTR